MSKSRRVSAPPPVGTRVVFIRPGWSHSHTGVVTAHTLAGERHRWADSEASGYVGGFWATVRFDHPVPMGTVGMYPIRVEEDRAVLAWEISALSEPTAARSDIRDEGERTVE